MPTALAEHKQMQVPESSSIALSVNNPQPRYLAHPALAPCPTRPAAS